MIYFTQYPSPIGALLIYSDGAAITGLYTEREKKLHFDCRSDDLQIFKEARSWLDQYFTGQAPLPELPKLHPTGTQFQKQVWQLLLQIPYGQTRSYGSIAKEIAQMRGVPRMSAQAVGQAVGANPISILVPCHRVIGTNGEITGYAGGIDKKIWLLNHEITAVED